MYSDYYDSIGKVAETDKEVADAMALELKRQRDNIELIASETLCHLRLWLQWAACLQISMPRDYLANVTTAAVSMLILLKISLLKELVNFSNATMLMFSLIRALRLILQFISLFLSRVIPLWV